MNKLTGVQIAESGRWEMHDTEILKNMIHYLVWIRPVSFSILDYNQIYFMLYCIDVEHYKESGMMVTGLQYKVGVESPICTDLLADIATDKYSDCVIVNNWVIYKNLGFANQYNLNKQYFSKRMFKIMGNVRDAFNNFVMYGCQRDYFDTLLKAYKLAKEGNGIEGFIERKHYNMALNFSKEQIEEIEENERDNVLLKQIFNVG